MSYSPWGRKESDMTELGKDVQVEMYIIDFILIQPDTVYLDSPRPYFGR